MIPLRAIPDVCRVKFARLIAYRAEMIIWIFTALLPLVMLAMWQTVATDNPIGNYGQTEFTRYFISTLIVRQLIGAWVVWQMNFDIRSGALSAQLLRPVNPIVVYALWMLTAVPLRVIYLSPLIAFLIFWQPDILYVPDFFIGFLFIWSSLLAWGIAFLIQCLFGILAFWLDRTEGLFGVWIAAWAVLSGYIAPLDLFPERFQTILYWLPFRSMLATPVELLSGFLTAEEALSAVAVQTLWFVVSALATVWLWKKGVKKYGAFGA